MTWPTDRAFARPDRNFSQEVLSRGHLIPKLPKQPGYWKRRARLVETIEWLTAMFGRDSPGYFDDVVLVDSTPVECGRSVDTARRSQAIFASADQKQREVAPRLFPIGLNGSRTASG